MSKAFCGKAYEVERSDPALFLVWPRVEARLGHRRRARALYERALEMHPANAAIMHVSGGARAGGVKGGKGGGRQAACLPACLPGRYTLGARTHIRIHARTQPVQHHMGD
jgi:hypothetical protein